MQEKIIQEELLKYVFNRYIHNKIHIKTISYRIKPNYNDSTEWYLYIDIPSENIIDDNFFREVIKNINTIVPDLKIKWDYRTVSIICKDLDEQTAAACYALLRLG